MVTYFNSTVSNRVNIFDAREEVDQFDVDLDVLKEREREEKQGGMKLKPGGIKKILNRRGKKEEEEKEMLMAAGQNTKHNRLRSDVLPEKCYNLGEYEHEKLLAGTRYVFSVKVFPGQEANNVWIGWVTPEYHSLNLNYFDHQVRVRNYIEIYIDITYEIL